MSGVTAEDYIFFVKRQRDNAMDEVAMLAARLKAVEAENVALKAALQEQAKESDGQGPT